MTIPLSNVVTARVVLLATLLLGGLVAAVSLYHSVYAQETIEYPENGEGPVAAYTAVDPEGDGVIWTLSGTDADDFSIEGGVLKFNLNSPDYENPTDRDTGSSTAANNVYDVTVEATDTESTKSTLPVIVKVTNVDEPGEVTLSTQQPLEELELTAALSDPDGFVASESWQWSRSSSANGPWTDIRDATTAAHEPTADDVDRYLLATASYTDGEGKYKSAAVVSANPVQMKLYVNQAPVFQDAEGNEISTIGRSVAEDAAAGGAVGGPVAATDTVGEVLTYSLSGTDEASFDIGSATGQITVDAGTLDFETKKTHDVTVTATDPLGLTDTIGVTITVTDVDEAPMVTGGATVKYHPENTPVTTLVDTYTATDDDDDDNVPTKPRKWSLSGADSDKFEISAVSGSNSTTDAELTFKASPDFEAKASAGGNNIYVLTVVATDSGGQTASRDVSVRVTNVEEEGTVTLSSLQPEVGVALTASLTDPDGEIFGLTWEWARADTMSGTYAAIAGATSAVYTPVSADDAKYLQATASYTDGEGSVKSRSEESAHSVQPYDTTNVAPVFSPETVSISVPESTIGNVGAAVTATDDDDTNLTYSLGGSDASSFTIERSSGQINVAAGTLDYETKQTHNVTVTATDASLESDTATVTITVTNVNEKPTLAGPASVSHDENTANTEAVADYTATDPEGTQIFWALTGDDSDDFSISTSGVLTFVASPDYENPADTGTNNVYNVTVEASDTNSSTSTLSVTVTVTNLDEDGTVTFTSLQPKVDVELTAMLTDPDGFTDDTESWQWSKSSSASGPWTDIVVATAEDYTPVAGDMDSYLRATASYDDGEGKYKTAAAVSDNAVEPEVPVNRTPAFEDADGVEIVTTTREVAENTAADGNVGAPVAARDPDNDTLTYTLGSTDADEFTIDSGTGQVGVGDGTELNFETKQSYTVTVTATDPSGESVAITVTIGVTDVDEDPSLTGPSEVFHAEDTATTTVATYAATDDEDDNDAPSKSLKWSLSGADADDFSIAAGDLKFKSKPDYEAPTDTGSNNMYDITVEATDSDGNTASKDVTVTVTNVDEVGEVILLSLQPQDGIPLRAELTDPDGGVSGVTWKWEWSDPGSGDCSNASIIWMPITRDNAKSAIYTPVKADEGDCLRATADYTDAHGSGKSADRVTANEVQAADTSNQPPVFPDKDPSTDGVQNEQMEISVPEDTAPVAAIGAPVEAAPDTDGSPSGTGET